MSNRMRRIGTFIGCCILLMSAFTWNEGRRSAETSAAGRPNVLLIVTDDQRWDTMDYMPRTKARIFDQGATFTNAFATTPLCCPSRASIFTGMYASTHGIHINQDPLTKPTFIRAANNNDYYTGLVGGKFLNSWNDRVPRSEFDYWAVGGQYDPIETININGLNVPQTNYITYTYRDYAGRFIEQAAEQPDPFMLVFAPNAPHLPAIPAPGDETLYPDLPLHRPPSFNESDFSDKPQQLQTRPRLTAAGIQEQDDIRRNQLQSLNAVDVAVDDLLTLLEDQGQLDNTMVIFMSDNGYLWGEHRMTGKTVPYEESIRIPFAVRYPPLIPTPVVYDQLVGNIDVAPTILDLAGIPISTAMDGRSLLGIVDGTATWRDDILLEGWLSEYNAVHTGAYVYIENGVGERELYDLQLDPFQLDNVADQPAYAGVQADMLARLDRLKPDRQFAPTIYDNTSDLIRYGGWLQVQDDRASGESYLTAKSATDSAIYRTPVTDTVTIITHRGPDQGIARIKIDGVDWGLVDLYAPVPESQYQITIANLPQTTHTIMVVPRNQRNAASRNNLIRIDAFAVNGIVVESDSRLISYTGWSGGAKPAAYLGGYRISAKVGATATFLATRQAVTIYTAVGPTFGIAEITINNVLWGTVDLYSPTYQFQHKIIVDGLVPETFNYVRFRVTGTKNAASTGTTIVFDGYSVHR